MGIGGEERQLASLRRENLKWMRYPANELS